MMWYGSRHSTLGFTLIELLVVVALIGLISVMALPSVSSYFQVSLNTTTREMASVVKDAYNTTLLSGKVHRIVYDLKKNQYWVEVGPDNALMDTKESLEKAAQRRRLRMQSSDAAETGIQFTMDKTVTKKKMSLPSGVKFEDLVTEQSQVPIEVGEAYTHIFPNGITEQTLVHLADSSRHHSSLSITPLLGRSDVYDRHIEKGEVFGK